MKYINKYQCAANNNTHPSLKHGTGRKINKNEQEEVLLGYQLELTIGVEDRAKRVKAAEEAYQLALLQNIAGSNADSEAAVADCRKKLEVRTK